MKMPLGMKVGLGPGHFVLHGDPAHPPFPKKRSTAPNFQPMSIVAKRSPISATAEHLLVKSMQHLSEKTQFSGFLFPQVLQKRKLGEVGK